LNQQWQRLRGLVVHRILHVDDTPHAIALGVALAMFVAIVPVIGLQTVVAVALAALFRANKAVCIPIVWVSNPVTALPISYACLWIGRLLIPDAHGESIMRAIHRLSGIDGGLSLFSLAFWKERVVVLAGLGAELWVGSILVGAVLGAICYPLTRWAVTTYRAKHRHRLHHRGKLAAAPSGANSVEQDHGQRSENENGNPGGQSGGGVGADVLGDKGHDVAKTAHQHAPSGVVQHIGG